MAKKQALVVESNPTRAKTLCFLLREMADCEAIHTPTVMGALREIKARSIDLVMTNTNLQKEKDGIKLVQFVLLRKIQAPPPLMMMVTPVKDRAVIQQCVRAGVVDYVVYPYDPVVLVERVRKALTQRTGMSEEQVQKNILESLEKILDLPTISPVYARIEALAQNPDTSAEDMAKVIEVDPSVTAKVLRLSNSAFFGFAHRIYSVKEAVALLGSQSVRAAVAAVTTFEALGRVEESANFNRQAFWEHSIGCGAIARVLAGKGDMDPDQAFVAGLLHDMGKVVLDGYFADLFARALQTAATKNISIFEAEQEELPVTHEEVGRNLAERWNLPEPLIEVIGGHHSLLSPASGHAQLKQLIHVADAHCRYLRVGKAGDESIWLPQETVLKALGLTAEALEEWKSEMETEIEKAQSILELTR